MKSFLSAVVLCLLFITVASGEDNWVFFHSEREYFFEPPHMGMPLRPLYQRETYYYDAGSLQTSGLFLWKTVKARIKIESWGIFNNAERIVLWEVDCGKRTIKRYGEDGRLMSHLNIESGDEAAGAFYKLFCPFVSR